MLLVRSLENGNAAGSSADLARKVMSEEEVQSWRGKVHSNSSLFLQLCRLVVSFGLVTDKQAAKINNRKLNEAMAQLTSSGDSSQKHRQPETHKLQQVSYHQADIRMCSHCLLWLDDNRSVTSC